MSENKKFNKNLKPSVYKHEIDGEHGRIEDRTVALLPARTIATQVNLTNWVNIGSIIKIEHKNWLNNSTEVRYYISSLPHSEVERIAKVIRAHWQVENNLHLVLDVVFREDDSRVRDRASAQNMSWMIKIAVYLLKKDTSKGSINSKMIRNCINPDNIIKQP